jgi:3-oxoacyl-[acyl-carrier protein] reductase
MTGATGRFDGRTGAALVVGGSGAIGRAVCERLAVLGSDVVLTYAGNEAAAEKTAATVREHGRTATVVRMRMADEAEVRAAVTGAGELHTLVVAASPVNSQVHVSRLTSERYVDQLHADAGGTFHAISAALPALRASRGSVVVVSSVANRRYVVRDVLSTASKAANEALVRAVAAEEGRYGVRANAVGVGILAEGMTEGLVASGDIRDGDLDHARARIPLGVLGTAAAVADAVAFLASDEAAYVTGQWLDVDGGYGVCGSRPRSAVTRATGWSSMTWWPASGMRTTGMSGPRSGGGQSADR